MIELEKTYLIKKLPDNLKDCRFEEIIDLYLPRSSRHSKLRLRKKGYMTLSFCFYALPQTLDKKLTSDTIKVSPMETEIGSMPDGISCNHTFSIKLLRISTAF